jgi:hypothetical protein
MAPPSLAMRMIWFAFRLVVISCSVASGSTCATRPVGSEAIDVSCLQPFLGSVQSFCLEMGIFDETTLGSDSGFASAPLEIFPWHCLCGCHVWLELEVMSDCVV